MKEVMIRLLTKLTSSKVMLVIASMVLLYIIVCSNLVAFKEIGYILAGIIASYMGLNVIQHKIKDSKDE